MTTVFLAFLATPSNAQETFNAHGFVAAPTDGDVLDPLLAIRAERQVPMSFGISGLFELAKAPLLEQTLTNDGVTHDHYLLDNVVALNVATQFSFHERVAVGLSLPVVLTSAGENADGDVVTGGPTLSDARITLPIGIVLPNAEDGTGVGVSVVPFADLPIGDKARWLGNSSFAGGGILAASFGVPKVHFGVNFGWMQTPGVSFVNLKGGGHLLGAISAAYGFSNHAAIRAEFTMAPRLAPETSQFAHLPGNESPAEITVSYRGNTQAGLNWTGGAATSVIPGAGAAFFRVFAGAGYTLGKNPDKDTDGDGFKDKVDLCVTDPETVNQYKDDDGCPDTLGVIAYKVLDQDGNAVKGAKVAVGGKEYTSDANGDVVVADLMPGTELSAGSVSHPWYKDGAVPTTGVTEGRVDKTINLAFLPGQLQVIVKAPDGKRLDATVHFEGGPETLKEVPLGTDGEEVISLRPGTWKVAVSATDFKTERRDVKLDPGAKSVVVLELTLEPAKAVVDITETEIFILEQVQFDYDKDTIKPESFNLLDHVVSVILDHKELKKIEVQGHTDDKGNDAYNQELSQRRVNAVVAYLTGKGVNPAVLSPVGYGESKPLRPNTSDANRAINRRVQFVVLDPAPKGPPPAAPKEGKTLKPVPKDSPKPK
jgi:outer membrane protein OmpA-like peptidoglycan-associated protein